MFSLSAAMSLFPVVGRYRNHVPTLFQLSMDVNPRHAVGISTISIIHTEV